MYAPRSAPNTLLLHHVVGDRGAVDLDERPVATLAVVVERAPSRPCRCGLAGDQHRWPARRVVFWPSRITVSNTLRICGQSPTSPERFAPARLPRLQVSELRRGAGDSTARVKFAARDRDIERLRTRIPLRLASSPRRLLRSCRSALVSTTIVVGLRCAPDQTSWPVPSEGRC